jgi:AraC-like ligand binding domain
LARWCPKPATSSWVNPGEMHDGAPMGGARGWRIIYLDPALVAREIANEAVGSELVIRPVARDSDLAAHVVRLFKQLKAPTPDQMVAEESLLTV